MFGSKRPRDVSMADLLRLIEERWPESDQLEFKAALSSAKGGSQDAWHAKREVIDKARNELLAEIVAFANGHGGWLLLGIEETGEKPGRAKQLSPLEDCSDLADRLRMMCRDSIEPPLPTIEIEGCSETDSDEGVVVIYAPRSHSAPHRLTQTRECYIRRHDRCEKMTMREIQDLTLNLARGDDAIRAKARLAEERFDKFMGEILAGGSAFGVAGGASGFGVRATAIPLTPIHIDHLDNDVAKHAPLWPFEAKDRTGPITIEFPAYGSNVVPLLRGRRWTTNRDRREGKAFERDVYRDGVIDYRLALRLDDAKEARTYASWIMAIWLNSMLAAELFRTRAGAPGIEYGLEVEIVAQGNPIPMFSYGQSLSGPSANIPVGRMVFPILSLGTVDEFPRLAAIIEQDLFNALGKDMPRDLEVSFPISKA